MPALKHVGIDQPCNRTVAFVDFDLPELVSLSLDFVTVDDTDAFGPSLSRSPKLESFRGYKVWGLSVRRRSRAV